MAVGAGQGESLWVLGGYNPCMALDLVGRPIAIAGASSGIGEATALACARAGMPVALGARRVERVAKVARACELLGVRASSHELDVTEDGACERFVEEATGAVGPVHAVFANAGYGEERSVLDTPMGEARAMFETNFFGTLSLIRAALPGLVERGAGHVLICSSCLAFRPVPHYSMYCATKAAQHHVGQALRVELHGTGVEVSTVHPIGTKTEFFEKASDRSGGLRLTGGSERFMQAPSKVADAVVGALRRPRPEVWTDAGARAVFPLSMCFPGLTGLVLRRMVRSRERARADGHGRG